MTAHAVEQMPLIDDGRVVDVATIRELVATTIRNTIPSSHGRGGGARLRPLTDETPKPMLPVGDRPLLERVVSQIRAAGFRKVLMAVNYRHEVIEDHFGDGASYGVEIDYIHERERLGSAGALGLVRAELDRPFVVVNADLLTNVNLGALARFHRDQRNALTVGVRQCAIQVPYGVVELDGLVVTG